MAARDHPHIPAIGSSVAGFVDYETFSNEYLHLPFKGKEYVIPPVGIADGVLLKLALSGDAAAMAEWDTGDRSYRIFLGASYDQMLADNVPETFVDRAHLTALTDYRHGRVAAQMAWETGQDPKAMAAIMEASRQILTLKDTDGDAASTTL